MGVKGREKGVIEGLIVILQDQESKQTRKPRQKTMNSVHKQHLDLKVM